MRLIDADALIETMKKVETDYVNAMTRPSWWTAYSVVSEQPTAYDVEKVVGQAHDELFCYNVPSEPIEEIIRKGGINE